MPCIIMEKEKRISRKNNNGDCVNGERHSWKIEYGDSTWDKRHIYSVDTHTCIKCGEVKNISHRGIRAT